MDYGPDILCQPELVDCVDCRLFNPARCGVFLLEFIPLLLFPNKSNVVLISTLTTKGMFVTKELVVFLLLFSIFYPSLARADTPDPPAVSLPVPSMSNASNPPDLSGWKMEATYRIDVRLSDLVVIYLGFEILYSNPDSYGEFALVTKRHRPLIVAKSDPRDDRMFKKAVVNFYTQKEQENTLQKRYEEADTIVCQKWRVAKDAKTGRPVRVGNVEVWFLDSGGNSKIVFNQKVSVGSVSELKSPDFENGILAGVRYSIGESYQIIRAEHVFLVMALKKEKKT